MRHCVDCRYWSPDSMDDNEEGLAVCLKQTIRTSKNEMRVVRTRGDYGCDDFEPFLVDYVGRKGHSVTQ